MIIVRLGNVAARDRQGNVVPGNQITMVQVPESHDKATRINTIVNDDGDGSVGGAVTSGLWPVHSAAPAAWVESNDPDLESELAEHFGCPIGEPADWMSSSNNPA